MPWEHDIVTPRSYQAEMGFSFWNTTRFLPWRPPRVPLWGLSFVPILRHFLSAFAAGPASKHCQVAAYLFSRSLLPAQPHNYLKVPARHNLLPSEVSRTERRTVGRTWLPELVLLFVGAFFYSLATCFARKKRNRCSDEPWLGGLRRCFGA